MEFDYQAAVKAAEEEHDRAAEAEARAARDAADQLAAIRDEEEQRLRRDAGKLIFRINRLVKDDELPLGKRTARVAAARAAIDDTTAPATPADSGTPTPAAPAPTIEPTSPNVADVIAFARRCKELTEGQQAALERIMLPIGATGLPVTDEGTPVEVFNLRKLAEERRQWHDAERAKTHDLEQQLQAAGARVAELEKAAKAAPSSKPAATPANTAAKAEPPKPAPPVRRPAGSTNGRPASAGLDVNGVTSRLTSAQPVQSTPSQAKVTHALEDDKSLATRVRDAVTSAFPSHHPRDKR